MEGPLTLMDCRLPIDVARGYAYKECLSGT